MEREHFPVEPEKPELETRSRNGQFGEVVVEYTPESETKWAEYLRKKRLYAVAVAAIELSDMEDKSAGS